MRKVVRKGGRVYRMRIWNEYIISEYEIGEDGKEHFTGFQPIFYSLDLANLYLQRWNKNPPNEEEKQEALKEY